MHASAAEIEQIKQQFAQIFGTGGKIRVIRAPGRVNLIGEHTDYNEGFVCPMAIEPEVRIVCRSRDDGNVRLASAAFPQEIVEFSTSEKITPGDPKWANYSRGVVAEMLAAGIPLTGMDALIVNTLPVGGGLSSSAAIEVGTARALLTLTGETMDPGRIALLCQKAEHEYAGVPVGIMDQTAVASGKPGHAMLLDCRDLSKQFVPIEERELRVVIVNSMVKHELSGGEYAQRRRQCEQGVQFFQREDPSIKALRDVTMPQIEAAKGKLDEVVWRRCRHVVSENGRTTAAAVKLEQKKYEEAGELMRQSHASLRDDYEVSIPQLDFLSEEAMKVKGVYGARMTGGGFGGCIVALAQPRSVEPLTEHVTKSYQGKYGITPNAFATTATAGASEIH
ncbi:MAG TPA: galactokinase [Tepidisphaeraceae bacterium]|nr:galactokinase [Tepidisphaeraceae bacterium]